MAAPAQARPDAGTGLLAGAATCRQHRRMGRHLATSAPAADPGRRRLAAVVCPPPATAAGTAAGRTAAGCTGAAGRLADSRGDGVEPVAGLVLAARPVSLRPRPPAGTGHGADGLLLPPRANPADQGLRTAGADRAV